MKSCSQLYRIVSVLIILLCNRSKTWILSHLMWVTSKDKCFKGSNTVNTLSEKVASLYFILFVLKQGDTPAGIWWILSLRVTWGPSLNWNRKRQKERSNCRCFTQIGLDYVNICSVRWCRGLLPPVLNVVAQIVAEAGSAVSSLSVGTRAAEFANSFSVTALSGHCGDVSSQSMDLGEGKVPAWFTGGWQFQHALN